MILSLFYAGRVITGTASLLEGVEHVPPLARVTAVTTQAGAELSVRLAEATPRMGDALVTVGHEAALMVAEPCLRLATALLGGPA